MRYDDSKNRLAGYDVTIGGITNSTDYTYGGKSNAPDLITAVNRNGTQKISYTYDGLNRLSVRNLNNFLTEYTYFQDDLNQRATTIVSSMKNGNDTLAYIYDELGNIISISKNGILVESYTYDALNQLKTVTRGTDTYTYNYDNGGNILSVTKNGTTIKSYTYGDTEWKDLLTAYNGQTITYDNIGNPLTYYNGSTFTWSDGRKLTGVTKGTDNISYTYDSNGLRTSKTVNGTVTEYYWLDGTLYAEKTGNQYIYYHYDDNGIAYGFTVVNGTATTDYYYIHNLQGDVIGIVDSTGTTVVEYTYDAWGKILATTGSLATTIGELNPFRYRGYYYDAETGFYYCRARYYDPEICRWISADGYVSTGQCIISFNMFAYCNNNPVNSLDLTGQKSELLPAIWEEIKQRLMGLSPVYVGAGTSTLADGPLPIVDAVAIGTVALITLASVGVGVAEGIRQYSHAKEKAKTQGEEKKKVLPLFRGSYWTAEIINGVVTPGVPLTYSEAQLWVASENNLLCINHAAAIAIVKFYPTAIWDPAHGSKESGYLNHYHLSSAHKNHIWYYGE